MSNSYYTHGAFPSTGSAATSASMRAELDLITVGFDKLPTLASHANEFVVVNSLGTAMTTTSVLPTATVTDNTFTIQDDGDNTKKFQFQASGITAGATRIFTVPDADAILVGTATTQTLTNKTLTAPVISSIVNTGTLTLPTSTDTLVGRNTTDTLTNKTLTLPVISSIVNTGTLTLPTSTDTLVGRATSDTLTNKTMSGSNNTFSNIANASLTYSSVTIGSSNLSLGGTLSTLAGVTISGATNTLTNIPNTALTNAGVTYNGVAVALGGSGTLKASTTNPLTIGTGLSGSSFDGGTSITIAIDSTVATLTGSQTLSNKSISGSGNTLTNIANASLVYSAVTIGSSSVSLGSTLSTLAGVTLSAPTITGIASFTGTGAVLLPKGTAAQQPTGVAGYLRFNTDSSQFEGYNGSAWASVGGAAIANDTSTTSNLYPLFASATSGTALTVYTGSANLLYKPSTGELQALAMVSSNGISINATTVAASYTIASGNNGFSVGPMTINSGITVTITSGQQWVVV